MEQQIWKTSEIIEDLDIPLSIIKYLITERRIKPKRNGRGRPMEFTQEDYLNIKKYWVRK
jgi:hypothetical protein